MKVRLFVLVAMLFGLSACGDLTGEKKKKDEPKQGCQCNSCTCYEDGSCECKDCSCQPGDQDENSGETDGQDHGGDSGSGGCDGGSCDH